MSLEEIYHLFVAGLQETTGPEYIAVVFGIASVWFSRMENVLVYPVGLVNTIIYIFLSIKGHLYGEATVNLYYTIMSIYGWMLWAKKDHQNHQPVLTITNSSVKEWVTHILFFSGFYAVLFICLSFLKRHFAPEAIPWADALASASAFTGMWLMAKKKVESWYWWIVTNISSIPLYFVKGFMFTSFYYFVLLVLAFLGLAEWKRKSKNLQRMKIR